MLLTRAQALMIIIGDPNVLQKDQNWYDVLKRLSNLNVMIGAPFVLRRPRSTNGNENNGITTGNNVSSAMTALRLI